jgi:hypothetical protein
MLDAVYLDDKISQRLSTNGLGDAHTSAMNELVPEESGDYK